ncbi:hypothetical protein VC51_gp12 [Pseudomonas phage vB_PaeP_C2-10_Ab22]|uniref:Uncharacterized protein n=1 Tax=Pseudomonas phage vB_PaeP_C2-10_Ab22 TaxID=1548906 RepID=A0A0A1IX26_9CAUD|nr:hypothetical protein VC51_gp12 [Pseudomonas phage vB_PaeP_C2-10_Ab22]CEF89727.1 hypothetical protein [Pseudomonas phage vB_PaeP_C2-10_Ab22]
MTAIKHIQGSDAGHRAPITIAMSRSFWLIIPFWSFRKSAEIPDIKRATDM